MSAKWAGTATGIILASLLALSGCVESESELPRGCRPGSVAEVTDGATAGTGPGTADGAPAVPGAPVRVGPENLAQLVFQGNSSVLLGMNRLHQAKEQVNLARASLLPSLNLGTLLYSSADASFAVSAVEFLMPFLIPSNWGAYERSKDLFEAELVALRLMKLNELASAYSLWVTLGLDQGLSAMQEREIADLARVERHVARLHSQGLAGREDLDRVKGQLGLARIHRERVLGLLDQEKAQLRKALGIGLESQLEIAVTDVPVVTEESGELKAIYDSALSRSPEKRQLGSLLEAARHATFQKEWGFVSGASVSSPDPNGMSRSVAFDNLAVSVGFNLGFARFPEIRLSQLHQRELELRGRELEFEIAATVESVTRALGRAKEAAAAALEAERSFDAVLRHELLRYEMGLTDLLRVQQAISQLRQASVESLRTRGELGLRRVVLHRLLLSDRFEGVQACDSAV